MDRDATPPRGATLPDRPFTLEWLGTSTGGERSEGVQTAVYSQNATNLSTRKTLTVTAIYSGQGPRQSFAAVLFGSRSCGRRCAAQSAGVQLQAEVAEVMAEAEVAEVMVEAGAAAAARFPNGASSFVGRKWPCQLPLCLGPRPE